MRGIPPTNYQIQAEVFTKFSLWVRRIKNNNRTVSDYIAPVATVGGAAGIAPVATVELLGQHLLQLWAELLG